MPLHGRRPHPLLSGKALCVFLQRKRHMFLYQIVCDAVGEEGRIPQLKMINDGAIAIDT